MYLLDYKAPKRLQEVISTLFGMWEPVLPTRPSSKTKAKQAVACFVYNSCYQLARGKTVMDVVLNSKAYTQPLIYNCTKVRRSVSYIYTRKLLDWLQGEGLIHLHVGSVKSWNSDQHSLSPEEVDKSYVELSSELIDLLVPDTSKQPLDRLLDVLEVRDSAGNKVTKRLTDKEKDLIHLLNTYNSLVLDTKLEVNGKRYWVQAKKVYNNNSFDCGGRTYMTGDTDIMQNSIRQDIRIDDQETVELDYSAVHIAIIAEWEKVRWGDDFDPYEIKMEGYDRKCLRTITKIATLCSLNAGSFNTARKALNYHLMKKAPIQQWKRDGLVPSVIASTEVLDKILTRNPYLRDWLYEGKGGLLQNIDSDMMNYVIDAFQQRGRVILPIHDGIVCQKEYTEWGKAVMIGAYKHVMGSKFNCRVEVK